MLKIYVFISTVSLTLCVITNLLISIDYPSVSSYFVLVCALGFGVWDIVDQRYLRFVKKRSMLMRVLFFIPIPIMLYTTKFNF